MAVETMKPERSLGDLFGDLARDTGQLISQEIALAQAEMRTKAARYARHAGQLAAAGALAYAGLLALVASAALGMAVFFNLALWASAAIVGGLLLIVGLVLLLSGLSAMRGEDPLPRQTIDSVKENLAWMKGHAR